jgi:hypothetical protein
VVVETLATLATSFMVIAIGHLFYLSCDPSCIHLNQSTGFWYHFKLLNFFARTCVYNQSSTYLNIIS